MVHSALYGALSTVCVDCSVEELVGIDYVIAETQIRVRCSQCKVIVYIA